MKSCHSTTMEWSPSKLEDIALCKATLLYRGKQKTVNPWIARGIFVHKRVEEFQKHRTTKRKPPFESSKKFANYSIHIWNESVATTDTIEGKEIKWLSEKNKDEIKWSVWHALIRFYDDITLEEPPFFNEIKVGYHIGDPKDPFLLHGRIDEVRSYKNCILLRDYKTSRSPGSRVSSNEGPTVSPHLDTGYQLTIYRRGFINRLMNDPEVSRACGISNMEIELLKKDPFSLDHRIMLQHYFLIDGIKRTTTRSKRNEREILQTIETFRAMIERGEIVYERGNHCNRCLYQTMCMEDLFNDSPFNPVVTQLVIKPLTLERPKPHRERTRQRNLGLFRKRKSTNNSQ